MVAEAHVLWSIHAFHQRHSTLCMCVEYVYVCMCSKELTMHAFHQRHNYITYIHTYIHKNIQIYTHTCTHTYRESSHQSMWVTLPVCPVNLYTTWVGHVASVMTHTYIHTHTYTYIPWIERPIHVSDFAGMPYQSIHNLSRPSCRHDVYCVVCSAHSEKSVVWRKPVCVCM